MYLSKLININVVILVLLCINLYLTSFIFEYVKSNRDDNMLDFNDKVKTEYGNLIKTGVINPDRVPSSLHGCAYADVEFGLGILKDYNIKNNIVECKAIREYAGIKKSYWSVIFDGILKIGR